VSRGSPDLNLSNRPVRTRTPGGVGGVRSEMTGPYPDCAPSMGKRSSAHVLDLEGRI